jgi:uncharacterized damage-inducible protein DinB
MTLTQQTAKHLRDGFFGGNWTTTNLKDVLSDVSWEEAAFQVKNFNTIAALTYHISYYLDAIIDVAEGRSLNLKDEYSFDCPEICSNGGWMDLQNNTWEKAEKAAALVEGLSDEQLGDDFEDAKYGTYYRNIHGLIEHTHYHLGQIVVLKRLVRNSN